jgi:threonine-phosphate decarboxylase
MTHFYALAGLRLGYGVFPVNLIERLQQCREPWTVNSLAQKAAAVSLKDKAYRKESMAVIRQEKVFLEKSFRKLGITFFPSDANFYLVKTAVAPEACRRLRSKGILVRDCSDFQGLDSSYMRIAVKSHRENTVLIKELTRIVAPGE